MADVTQRIRNITLSDADVELILSALIYLKNMTEVIAAETGGLIAGDEAVVEQLAILIRQFEEQ